MNFRSINIDIISYLAVRLPDKKDKIISTKVKYKIFLQNLKNTP